MPWCDYMKGFHSYMTGEYSIYRRLHRSLRKAAMCSSRWTDLSEDDLR